MANPRGSGFPPGALDWEEYLGALEEINYRGYLTVWPDPDGDPLGPVPGDRRPAPAVLSRGRRRNEPGLAAMRRGPGRASEESGRPGRPGLTLLRGWSWSCGSVVGGRRS